LSPGGGGVPPFALKACMESTFGDLEALKEELGTAATTLFGSGWAWLVLDGAKPPLGKTWPRLGEHQESVVRAWLGEETGA